MSEQKTPQIPTEVYAVFAGGIDQGAVNRIFANLAGAMERKFEKVHLLFQSFGGVVGDGVCLYNFFKSLPIELTLYNVGAVQSIASIAYLGAKKRKTSAHATFMIHKTVISIANLTPADRLKAVTESMALDDKRTDTILRSHLKLPDTQWDNLSRNDLVFSGEEAIKIGLATEIGEFAPPPGTQIFNI